MSNEFSITFPSGSNLYVILRRASDSYAWNGTTWEVWADGNIATYDVALTDQGGNLYTGDFPSAIAGGDYTIIYYERTGATPAIDDSPLLTDNRHWDGEVLAEDSDIDLSGYALTTLDDQKRFMRIDDSDDDTLLTQLINAVSAEIERVTGIEFKARDRRERLNGNGQRRLTLKRWPVIDVFRLAWGNSPALTVSYSGSAVRADVGVSDTALRISSYSTSGAATTNRLLFTDYPSVSLLATAIAAVSGWSATVNQNVPSADLNHTGGQDAKSHSVTLGYPDRGDIDYSVDHATGLLELRNSCGGQLGCGGMTRYGGRTGYESIAVFPGGHQYLFVHYRAGYETIPADVAIKCNVLVQELYDAGESSAALTMASLGPFTWRANSEQVRDIQQTLAHYIDVSQMIGGV